MATCQICWRTVLTSYLSCLSVCAPCTLQEALWKLDTARKRAATWGFDMLVPLGRTNRGIQTQAGEIWAATAAVSSSSQAATRSMTAIAAQGAAGASTATAVLVTTTSSRSSSSSRTFRMLAASGGDLSAEADPEAAAARLLAGHNSTTSTSRPSKQSAVPRKIPAFTQHDSSSKNTSGSKRKTGSATVTDTSAASSAVQMPEQQLLAAAARVLSGAESAQVVMPVGDLLKLVASLYSSKAAADARALRSHSQPLSMWAFVCRQLLGPAAGLSTDNSGSGRDGASPRGSPTSTEASEAMVQLLGSLKAHAAANKEVAAFQAALVGSMPRPRSATESRSRSGSRSTTPTGGPAGGSLRGTWGDVSGFKQQIWGSMIVPAVWLPVCRTRWSCTCCSLTIIAALAATLHHTLHTLTHSCALTTASCCLPSPQTSCWRAMCRVLCSRSWHGRACLRSLAGFLAATSWGGWGLTPWEGRCWTCRCAVCLYVVCASVYM